MSYTSPNAPSKRDVLGTWLLGVLAGHKRYAHITGLRGDAVSPQISGNGQNHQRRRATPRLGPCEAPGKAKPGWRPQLLTSVQAALSTPPWMLDIDTTIKPL